MIAGASGESAGVKKNKFGIPMENALEFYKLAKGMKNICPNL